MMRVGINWIGRFKLTTGYVQSYGKQRSIVGGIRVPALSMRDDDNYPVPARIME